LAWALLAILTVPCPLALAQNDIEDPNTYPGSWYRIVLDTDGNYLRGDGHGYGEGTWYHYPETGWHRQWFYNQPFSTDRKGVLRYEVYIKAVDPNRRTYVEVRFNWATPEWHRLGLNRPPLPDDAPTATEEAAYMQSRRIYLVDNWFIGTIEPIATFTIEEYNPAWVSIDIRGRNAYVYRGAMHECQAQEGACCNPATEDCFLSLEEDCRAPYKWLGPGSTCDKCRLNASWMDFGDAPDDRYGTFEASDGARHTVVAGVCLGNIVDSELDAVPNATATGDDLREDHDEDGVAFLSSLSPGESATIEVTASTQGYLNAWSDFDQDGGFDGLGEQIFADELLARGLNTLSFKVPLSAETGATFARFRFNTRGLLSWNGPAADGEVEDYAVTITEHLEPQNNSGKGGLKWSQPPQPFDAATPYIFNGWDEPSALHLHRIAADDWRCEDDAPVTGIQWWGSFEGWTDPLLPPELPIAFHIALWTDSAEPNVAGPAKSGHPDVLIWETFCTNWAWSIAGYDSDPRATNDGTCFQFTHLLNQNQWFYPIPPAELNAGQTSTVYWLSIAAVYDTGALARHTWGWTTRPHSSEGGAVQITEADDVQTLSSSWPPGFGSQWLSSAPLEHPRGTPWDLAFELLTSHSSRGEDRALAPVYRFWSDKLQAHFYTISESEKNKLVDDATWTYEGIAFYAYPPGQQPAGAKPVYRFWSDKLGRHFYSISESEKEKLVQSSAEVWTFEGPAWYAFE
jgi:hypothetical protein